MHRELARAARYYRNKVALNDKQTKFTYQELDEASSVLAEFLLEQNVKPGDRVGILFTKCVWEVVCIYAIFKAGGVMVHLNPYFKWDQIAHVVADCDVKTLLLHENRLRIVKEHLIDGNFFDLIVCYSKKGICHDLNCYDLNSILKRNNIDESRLPKGKRSDTAAIIYTSGSTGKPKGVVVTHQIFYEATMCSVTVFDNNQHDCLISVTPFSFDGALSQLFTMVNVGGRLVLQESLLPKDIVTTLIQHKITGVHAMPTFWRMLNQRHSPFGKHEYPHLRYVSIIGEVFPGNELSQLRKILMHSRFFMMYGTTEAFRSTFLPPSEFDTKPGSVGKPFPGVKLRVLDEFGRDCPTGKVGMIVHSGAFVSPGYWKNPLATREKFRDGAYYTGDLGKLDSDGYLYFHGREDTMLKVNGYRVSPEEIESFLTRIPGVEAAMVTGVYSSTRPTTIKAFVVKKAHADNDEFLLKKHCKQGLPHYMIPTVFEFTEELPRTESYKIRRITPVSFN